MTSFLQNINKIVKLLPDNRPNSLECAIRKKCEVLYFPVSFPQEVTEERFSSTLHIVWPHRWEFDKGPEDFFKVMLRLKTENYSFKLSVLGGMYADVPEVFNEAKQNFTDEIIHFGYVEKREEYFQILRRSHIVLSTAKHEFFGVGSCILWMFTISAKLLGLSRNLSRSMPLYEFE
ncbi:hypothetical protein JTB14_012185 [Gonioctena quinquepunctata]|nr:hypothetical protein JTB14_012185 [Gonioctena quinquepunctata]